MENQQPEALILVNDRPSAIGDDLYQWALDAEDMIRRLHARVQELEAMLDAVGAGGVSAQRVTQAKDHIAQPLEMVAAPVVLPEPDSYLFQHEDTGQTMFVEAQQVEWGFEANNPRLQKISGVYTEEQVRGLLDKATCTKSQTAQEPFGYFKAEPFGWRDCAETDEGAVALYEAPQPQAVDQAPVAWRYQTPTGWHATTDAAAANRVSAHHPIEPLYASPQPQADARAAERVDALYKALDVCSAELFAQCAHQGRAMKYVEQARKALAAEQCARAAIAAAKEI